MQWEKLINRALQHLGSSAQSAKRNNDIAKKYNSGGYTTKSTYPNQQTTANIQPKGINL